MLLDKGVDVNLYDTYGKTPLMLISSGYSYPNLDFFNRLIDEGAIIDAQDRNKNTALMIAIMNEQHEDYEHKFVLNVIDILMDEGANINLQNKDGNTPLMLAVKFDHLDIVKKLLKSGADLDLKNNDGKTALDEAIKVGNQEIIDILIRAVKAENKAKKRSFLSFNVKK